jgi:hypothetical protein
MSAAIPPLPQYVFMAWCSVKEKHRDTFTLVHLVFLNFRIRRDIKPIRETDVPLKYEVSNLFICLNT